ncbi:MAG TPA: response regulator transcription factor, partial [Bacteroidota bacterium]|nr:response regulator transcription factor [Bacteroidota bacterium]
MSFAKHEHTIKVLVADDHTIVRRGLVSLLSLNKNFEVIGEAADGQTAVTMALAKEPDVVLMDVNMPVKDGLKATSEILARFPQIKILILSGYDSPEYVQKILASGAHGFLLKTTSPDELYAAIHAVYTGDAFFSPRISKILLDNYVEEMQRPLPKKKSADYKGPLSKRECEILKLIALGKSHQQIAAVLHLSVRTVDTHRNNIIKKTNLHDAASLVTYALSEGIVDLP